MGRGHWPSPGVVRPLVPAPSELPHAVTVAAVSTAIARVPALDNWCRTSNPLRWGSLGALPERMPRVWRFRRRRVKMSSVLDPGALPFGLRHERLSPGGDTREGAPPAGAWGRRPG